MIADAIARGTRAVAAELDHHGDDDLRIVRRREADEPGVVQLLPERVERARSAPFPSCRRAARP